MRFRWFCIDVQYEMTGEIENVISHSSGHHFHVAAALLHSYVPIGCCCVVMIAVSVPLTVTHWCVHRTS